MRETLRLSLQIVRRNWWVYRKDLLANIAPTLTDPAFMILSLGVGMGAYVAQIQGHTYVQFLAPGLAVSTAMFTAFFETSYGFFVRMTYESIFVAMLTTPIRVREIVWGEFLWVGLKGAIMVTGVCVVLALFGLFPHVERLPLCPLIGLGIALPLGSLGLIACCSVRNINQFQTVYAFVISPLYFFSGIFFPVEQMSPPLQWVAKSLPLYHAVRLSQALFWDEAWWQTWTLHAPVLIAYALVLLPLAYYRVRSKLQR